MSEEEKKPRYSTAMRATIEEGEQFKQAPIPKVVNLDQKLKDSYPEGFFDRSNQKRSSRKSRKASKSASKSKLAPASSSKKSRSSSKAKDVTRKSSKKSALQKKSEKKS